MFLISESDIGIVTLGSSGMASITTCVQDESLKDETSPPKNNIIKIHQQELVRKIQFTILLCQIYIFR